MESSAKDYVKNLSKDQMKNKGVFDKIEGGLTEETEKQINDNAEKSYQDFVKTHNLKGMTTEQIEQGFNDFMDTMDRILDKAKIKDIEKVNSNIEESLKNLEFTLQLENLQASIQEQKEEELATKKDATLQTEVVSVNGNDLHMKTFKDDDTGNNVDKNEIAGLFNEDFEKKDILLNLLKSAKTKSDNSSDEIREFQRIVAELDDNATDEDIKKSKLGRFGVDGKFGGNTLAAFKAYVSKHKNQVDNTQIAAEVSEKTNEHTPPQGVVETGSEDEWVSMVGQEQGNKSVGKTEVQAQPQQSQYETLSKNEKYPNDSDIKELNDALNRILGNDDLNITSRLNNDDNNKTDLFIPKELCDKINILYNDELKKYVKTGPDDKRNSGFIIPANIKVHLKLNEDNSYSLILGNDAGSLTELKSDSNVNGDPSEYNSEGKWKLEVDDELVSILPHPDPDNTGNINDDHTITHGDSESDETETGESVADIQIAYNADMLILGLKKGREAKSEMDALKLLLGLKGFVKLSYSIEGYKPKGQEKKDLKRLRSTLRLFANSHESTVTITDFFRLAAEQYSTGGNFDISKLGKEPSHVGTKKSYKKFGELYSKYRKQEGGPYFKKVMGIMEDYFLRGDVNANSIRALYDMENIGTWEGYIDPDKEREVFRGLFDGKNVGVDLGVPYESSTKLKELKKIVKKIDLNELFQSGKLDGKKNNLNKREEQFYDLYQSYKKGELQNDNSYNNYYKKVFDFLVGAGRGNTSIVNVINAINLVKIADIDFVKGGDGINSRDEIHYNSEEEKKFILLLSDFNHDARVDVNDSGLKMGQQLRNIYKSVNIDLNNASLDDQLETGGHVWSNILSFAKQYFNNISNPDVANKLDGISKVEDLNKKIQDDPTILIALQNMLKNSSISINSICRYGDKASEMFMKELMQDEKMDEQFDKIFEGRVSQGAVNNDPTIKQALKPIVLGSLMDNSVGMGLGAAYDAGKAGNISAVLGVADVPGVGPTAGLVVGYGNSIPVGDKVTIDLGASGGASYNQGFVPMFSVYAGTSVRVSDGAMKKDFDVTKMTKIHVGGNFTMVGPIPSWGLSAGVSMDKLAGIDKQESMLRPNITSVISEFLNDTEITGIIFGGKEIKDEQKEKCISNIREKLGNMYGKTDKDLLDKAANNLYTGFAYYAAQTDFADMSENNQKAIKDKIINNIVNNYVTQRRNDKIEELNGKVTVSDVTVGVQFLAGYRPIPMLGVTFTKYRNLYSRETPESISAYESMLSTGQGMGYLERSVNQENGNILRGAIKYLNEKISIASRNDLEEIQLDEKENIVFIPRELCNSVNIFADDKMKDYIRSTEKGFEIPANTQLSLLSYTRTDATKFDLIIGDHKKESGDIAINITSKFKGDPKKYESKEGGKWVMTKQKINSDMEKLFELDDFPIGKCVEIKNNMLYFETKINGITCSDNVKIEDGNLIVPASGCLTIKKYINGNYKAGFVDQPKAGFVDQPNFHVDFIDEKKVNKNRGYTKTIENLFESYNELNTIFDRIEKRLSKLDDGLWGNYASFMDYASDMADNVLDADDYENAFKELQKMLKKLSSADLKDTNLSALKQKIDEGNLSDDEKMMIVDRFKMLFSYHINLSDEQKDGANLVSLVKGRGDVYETKLTGYDHTTPFPLAGQGYREKIVDQLKDKTSLERKVFPNLIGMTAFYRYNKEGKRITQGRGYSMTEMGKTTVLGNAYEELTGTNLEQSRDWFISNLDMSKVHKDALKSTLAGNLGLLLNLDNIELSDEDLKTLLRGEELDIGTRLDIGQKKVKINMKYMFYLLGECANESIGVNLEQIVVNGGNGGNDGNNGIVSVDVNPELSYEGVSGVYAGSAEAISRYEIGHSNSATVGFAYGKSKPKEDTQVFEKPTTEPETDLPTATEPETQVPSTEGYEDIENPIEGGGADLGEDPVVPESQGAHKPNKGGLFGRGLEDDIENNSSIFGGNQKPNGSNLSGSGGGLEGGGANLGGGSEEIRTPGTHTVVDDLGTHVINVQETDDAFIVTTTTTLPPQHGQALAPSQSKTHTETRVIKKEKKGSEKK